MYKTVSLLKKTLPDTVYIPDGFPKPGKQVQISVLASELSALQNGCCPYCGEPLKGLLDVHEGIVTKGDVQGWPKHWRCIILNRYNCVYIHRHCHQHGRRDFYWEYKCMVFGEEEIRKWYYSLPFKVRPREFV